MSRSSVTNESNIPNKSTVVNTSTQSILKMINKRYNGWAKLDRAQDLIKFDAAEHSYTLNNKRNDISVTGIVSKWFPFDSQTVSLKCVRSKKYSKSVVLDESTGQVDLEKSAANIRQSWAERATAGTQLHKQLETYLGTEIDERGADLTKLEQLLTELETFLFTNGYAMYKSEVKVFSEETYDDSYE